MFCTDLVSLVTAGSPLSRTGNFWHQQSVTGGWYDPVRPVDSNSQTDLDGKNGISQMKTNIYRSGMGAGPGLVARVGA